MGMKTDVKRKGAIGAGVVLVLVFAAIVLYAASQSNFTTPATTTTTRPQDICDIGKDIVPGSETQDYECEGLDGCEWRPLGCDTDPDGTGECYYACCPIGLTISDAEQNPGLYGRCFMLID
jgi:hypothetical protein